MSEIITFSDYGFTEGKREASVHKQRFSVAFDYDVHFARGVFRTDNRLLLDVFDRKGEGRRHRVFVCLDRGLPTPIPISYGRSRIGSTHIRKKSSLPECRRSFPAASPSSATGASSRT